MGENAGPPHHACESRHPWEALNAPGRHDGFLLFAGMMGYRLRRKYRFGAIHFTWKPDPVAVDAITAEIEALLLPLGARPHWGKLMHAPLYPRLTSSGDSRTSTIRRANSATDS